MHSAEGCFTATKIALTSIKRKEMFNSFQQNCKNSILDLLVYLICHSISSEKNLVINLNGDDTKSNVAHSINILMTVTANLINDLKKH